MSNYKGKVRYYLKKKIYYYPIIMIKLDIIIKKLIKIYVTQANIFEYGRNERKLNDKFKLFDKVGKSNKIIQSHQKDGVVNFAQI